MRGTDLVPEGQIWICGACGKKSRTLYGFVNDGTAHGSDFAPDGERVAERGWDESCMLNAVLCRMTPGAPPEAMDPQPDMDVT